MRRILLSQKTFGIEKEISLADLKKTYRSLMKEWHPDTLQNNPERLRESELKSIEIIDAYKFLVSINSETHEANKVEYNLLTSSSSIEDWEYKGITLKITFINGVVYEYLGVPKKVYIKMINSGALARFARRHIYNSYTFRKAVKEKH